MCSNSNSVTSVICITQPILKWSQCSYSLLLFNPDEVLFAKHSLFFSCLSPFRPAVSKRQRKWIFDTFTSHICITVIFYAKTQSATILSLGYTSLCRYTWSKPWSSGYKTGINTTPSSNPTCSLQQGNASLMGDIYNLFIPGSSAMPHCEVCIWTSFSVLKFFNWTPLDLVISRNFGVHWNQWMLFRR